MNRVNIIPMAGAGQRYIDAGYATPKPLIEVDGTPMFIKASEGLPDADQWVFLCNQLHLDQFNLKEQIEYHFSNYVIIPIQELTRGQAETVLFARDFVSPDAQVHVGVCDSLVQLPKNSTGLFKKCDAIIWTTQGHKMAVGKPSSYGWVSSVDGVVKKVSCKIPLSNPEIDPMITGAFSFKKASILFDSIDSLINNDIRVNNEFYLDMALNETIADGWTVSCQHSSKYISWGTPDELNAYLK